MQKQKILATIIFITLFLSASPVLAQWNVSNVSGFGLPNSSIYGIIENLLAWLLAILGMISVIAFAVSGIFYLTAAGDENQAEKAKKAMKYAIIGVIVGISGLVVLRAVDSMLNGWSLFYF